MAKKLVINLPFSIVVVREDGRKKLSQGNEPFEFTDEEIESAKKSFGDEAFREPINEEAASKPVRNGRKTVTKSSDKDEV